MIVELIIQYYYGFLFYTSVIVALMTGIWILMLIPTWVFNHAKGTKTKNYYTDITVSPFKSTVHIKNSSLLICAFFGIFVIGLMLLPVLIILSPIFAYTNYRHRVNSKADKAVAIINGEKVED